MEILNQGRVKFVDINLNNLPLLLYVAREQRIDVVLVDTAGRMQDNEPLMRALSKVSCLLFLISVQSPVGFTLKYSIAGLQQMKRYCCIKFTPVFQI